MSNPYLIVGLSVTFKEPLNPSSLIKPGYGGSKEFLRDYPEQGLIQMKVFYSLREHCNLDLQLSGGF